jgi:hypothetical protein
MPGYDLHRIPAREMPGYNLCYIKIIENQVQKEQKSRAPGSGLEWSIVED